ncbi:MAG: SprT family zinc-dependent metalloprotease [bacterium]|nr:SprT family zinc-dependent metalloprotease [bacterium]
MKITFSPVSDGAAAASGTIETSKNKIFFIVETNPRLVSRCTLQLKRDFQLIITTSPTLPLTQITSILADKLAWIEKRIKKITLLNASTAGEPAKTMFTDGQALRMYDRTHTLRIVVFSDAKRPKISLSGAELFVFLPPSSDPKLLLLAIKRWYIKHGREILLARLQHHAHRLNVSYGRVFIKDQRSLWGSCSSKTNLNFNWRLLMVPPEVLDYVIIHELAHLVQLNHSKKFWAIVQRHCPNYQSQRAWVRKNGAILANYR